MKMITLAFYLSFVSVPAFAANSYQSNLDVSTMRDKWTRYFGPKIINNYSCPELVTPQNTISVDSIYCPDDPTHSIVCSDREALYEQEMANIDLFVKTLRDITSDYIKTETPQENVLNCALDHLYHWGVNHSLQSAPQPTHQGEYVRFMTLTKASEFYLILSDEGLMDKDDIRVRRTRYWFGELAKGTIQHFNETAGPNSSIGNHRYWAGLGVMNVGIIRDNAEFFDWGKSAFDIGVGQIQGDGSLPVELNRGLRSLSYHFYAGAPLIAMEDKLKSNGITSSTTRQKVQDLINLSYGSYFGYQTSALFTQEHFDEVSECTAVAALEIYLKRNSRLDKNPMAKEHASIVIGGREDCKPYGRNFFTSLGGEVTLLHGVVNIESILNK